MEVFLLRLVWQGIPRLRDHFTFSAFSVRWVSCVDSPRPIPNKNVQFVLICVMVKTHTGQVLFGRRLVVHL